MLRVLGQGLEFIAFVVLARRLGAADFGRLSVAFLIGRYGALIADFGASVQGPRDVAAMRDPASLHALARRRLIVALALSIGAGCAAAIVGELALGLMIVAMILAGGLNRDWLALGRLDGTRSAMPVAIRGVALAAGAIAVHTVGQASLLIGVGYLASGAASALINRLEPIARDIVGRVPVRAWMLLGVVMAQVYTSLDTVLLGTLRSVREAGIYAGVYRLPLAWITVSGLVIAAAVPVATEALTRDRSRLPQLRRAAIRVGGGLGALLLISAPIAALLVVPVFGEEYSDGRWPLALLMVATAVATVTAPIGALYLGVGVDRTYAQILTVGAVLNLAANVVLIPRHGMMAAAATTVASETLVLVLMLRALLAVENRGPEGTGR